MTDNTRVAYDTLSILAEGHTLSNNSWDTGLNCNQIVFGPSGSGKTRNFLKPNLLQANASYLVMDTKGSLYSEMGPILADLGYDVQCIDFTNMQGTVGYDPLDVIHVDPETGEFQQCDVISIAKAICPIESTKDPFWDHEAANYLTAFIAYVLENVPSGKRSFASVLDLFEQCADDSTMVKLFESLGQVNPKSFAYRTYLRFKKTMTAERMHASVLGILSEKLMCLGFKEAIALYKNPRKVDFAAMGHHKVALFVSVSDVDFSLAPLTDLFVNHAIQGLIAEADAQPNHMMPVPVRLMLDDFANLNIPDFDKTIAVTRSRELWVTILCQSVSQLQSRYGCYCAESIMANCDVQLVLSFNDMSTANTYASVAGRTMDTLRATPAGKSWLFVSNRKPMMVTKYDVTKHPNYMEIPMMPKELSSSERQGDQENGLSS